MPSLLVLTAGIVECGAGRPGMLSAYVVLNEGRASRLFKVRGFADTAIVTELDAATTIDISRFRRELADDLEPLIAELRAQGSAPSITVPKPEWVTGIVERYLRRNP
jgi:hypothetical protein